MFTKGLKANAAVIHLKILCRLNVSFEVEHAVNYLLLKSINCCDPLFNLKVSQNFHL